MSNPNHVCYTLSIRWQISLQLPLPKPELMDAHSALEFAPNEMATGAEDQGAMRYFFHADDGETVYPDRSGEVFATYQDATAHAEMIARELAADPGLAGGWVIVTDEQDREVSRVAIP